MDRPIAIAITAMGGQGGGVLADWIVSLAEAEGWVAQSTSVPGVAQRTGATIYYVEIIRAPAGAQPVLALMPVPGDVDVVIAAELMEAGRAMQRGLVSPDRTVLIASTHRSLSMLEKIKPGDGTADGAPVLDAGAALARRFLAADMQALAERHGSVISAALFGALAASRSAAPGSALRPVSPPSPRGTTPCWRRNRRPRTRRPPPSPCADPRPSSATTRVRRPGWSPNFRPPRTTCSATGCAGSPTIRTPPTPTNISISFRQSPRWTTPRTAMP
jgi:indolepyruvate ferredoxin oxidoreductase beta subunit